MMSGKSAGWACTRYRDSALMVEILKEGLIESDDQVSMLVQSYKQVVLPNDDDLDLTHWWVIRDDGVETLYLGTAETFSTYVREQNGGLQ